MAVLHAKALPQDYVSAVIQSCSVYLLTLVLSLIPTADRKVRNCSAITNIFYHFLEPKLIPRNACVSLIQHKDRN